MKTPTPHANAGQRANNPVERPDSAEIPPNLAKRFLDVEQERKNGLLMTHEDVLKQIHSWPQR